MRRVSALLAALAMSITGLTAIPSQASVTDGTYPCTSGSFTVTSGVVSNGGTCTGHANIPNGVTALGQDAFYLSGLSTISMPDTLTSIGQSALRHIPMTSVTIPSSVQTIGHIAFATTYLTSITFASPSSLTTIDTYAFQSSRFTSITIPASVTSIGTGAFQLNTHLTNISFLGTVPSGGPWEAPSSVVISPVSCTTGSFAVVDNVVTTGSSCTGTANIPSGVTAIGAGAFQNSSVTAITLPAGVTEIRDYAFYYATSLSSINLPSSVTSIGVGAFINTTSLAALTLPANLTSLGNQAFWGSSLTGVSIPSGITTIGDEVFLGAASLVSVTLPSTLTSIGSKSFMNATSLSSITLPSSLTSIGTEAFKGNTGLTTITIPSSVTSIGSVAFNGTRLVSLTIPSSITSISNDAFGGITTLTSLTLPSTLTSIGAGAFYDATSLTSLTVPSGVLSIGDYAFGNNTALSSVALPNTLTSIGSGAFRNATSLSSITLPQNLTSIGEDAFRESALNSVVVPGSLTQMGNCAFCVTQQLTSVVIQPGSLTNLGQYTFATTPLLNSVTLPNNILVIGDGVFRNAVGYSPYQSQLTSITLPSNLTTIGGSAFEGQNALTNLTIPASVDNIASQAFFGATSLVDVTFEGLVAPTASADAFSQVRTGAKANIQTTATGFGNIGSTWNGLTVEGYVIAPPVSNAPSQQSPIRPLPKVVGVQLQPGNSARSSIVKLQLSGVEQGQSNQDIQIKIFDAKGNLYKVLTVPINGTAGSLEVAIPLAIGQFTVEANTIGAAGLATPFIKASSLIIQRAFYSSPPSRRSPVLLGEAFARPVVFASFSSVLTVSQRKALLLVAADLRMTRSSVAITGFSAKSGISRSFDKNLSNSRALAVARFLRAQGLSNILYVAGYGSISSQRNTDSSRKVELRIIR